MVSWIDYLHIPFAMVAVKLLFKPLFWIPNDSMAAEMYRLRQSLLTEVLM